MTCSFDFCNIESHLFDKLELDKIQQEGLVPTKIGRRCTLCRKKFPDLVSFKPHSADGQRLRCEDQQCIARFPTERELRRHMRVEHKVFEPMSEL